MPTLIYLILLTLIIYYAFKTYLQSIAYSEDHPGQIRYRWRGSILPKIINKLI